MTDFYPALPNSVNGLAETDSRSFSEEFFFNFTEKKETKAAQQRRKSFSLWVKDNSESFTKTINSQKEEKI